MAVLEVATGETRALGEAGACGHQWVFPTRTSTVNDLHVGYVRTFLLLFLLNLNTWRVMSYRDVSNRITCFFVTELSFFLNIYPRKNL